MANDLVHFIYRETHSRLMQHAFQAINRCRCGDDCVPALLILDELNAAAMFETQRDPYRTGDGKLPLWTDNCARHDKLLRFADLHCKRRGEEIKPMNRARLGSHKRPGNQEARTTIKPALRPTRTSGLGNTTSSSACFTV